MIGHPGITPSAYRPTSTWRAAAQRDRRTGQQAAQDQALEVEQLASRLQLRDLERQVQQLQQQNERGLSPDAK
ncbi:MAG: hypothetical protein VB137_08335 [Burkholderia sp.]